jgi:hypothetical protein
MANTIKILDKREDDEDFDICFTINVGIYCDTIDEAPIDGYLQYGFIYNDNSYKYLFLQKQLDNTNPLSQVVLVNDELDNIIVLPENTMFTITTENALPENGTKWFTLKHCFKNSF